MFALILTGKGMKELERVAYNPPAPTSWMKAIGLSSPKATQVLMTFEL
jgi:hypothetical protein